MRYHLRQVIGKLGVRQRAQVNLVEFVQARSVGAPYGPRFVVQGARR